MVGGCPWGIDRSEASGEFGDIRVAQAGHGADANAALKGITFDLILAFIYVDHECLVVCKVMGVWRRVYISALRQDNEV